MCVCVCEGQDSTELCFPQLPVVWPCWDHAGLHVNMREERGRKEKNPAKYIMKPIFCTLGWQHCLISPCTSTTETCGHGSKYILILVPQCTSLPVACGGMRTSLSHMRTPLCVCVFDALMYSDRRQRANVIFFLYCIHYIKLRQRCQCAISVSSASPYRQTHKHTHTHTHTYTHTVS